MKEEINEKNNDNLTITKTINRLGVAFFIFIFNIMISIFVFILTGIMIFSQILFIIFAVFLPISFLLSMVPSFNHLMKTTIMRLFNVIMMRAGITLVLTISFSLSAMIYSLTASQPFFVVAFMQIVVFAGIYFKLNDLMGMMALNSADSQNTGGRVMRRPKQTATRAIRKIVIGGLALRGLGTNRKEQNQKKGNDHQNSKNKTIESENPMNKNREQPRKNALPFKEKKQLEEKNMEQKDKRTGKQSASVQQLQDKAKQEATRKFKQSKYKGAKPDLSTKLNEEESKKTQESKRRNAPTRTLEKPTRKPVGQSNTGANKTNNSKSKLEDTSQSENQRRKYGKKNTEKTPIINKNSRVIKPREMKTLEKGASPKREVTLNQEKRTTVSKGVSTKKSKTINGKGAKRR